MKQKKFLNPIEVIAQRERYKEHLRLQSISEFRESHNKDYRDTFYELDKKNAEEKEAKRVLETCKNEMKQIPGISNLHSR